MPKCKVCEEKQTEIDRILKAYRKDKENADKKIKTHLKIEGALVGITILTAFFGKDGINIILDLVREFLL